MPSLYQQKSHPYFPISVVMPTLNSGKTLEESLRSILAQEYPQALIEIIIIDGGSQDNTLIIAEKYRTKILFNKLKTSEAGKAIGIKKAQGELILLMDSDNILTSPRWLLRMIQPFKDTKIIGAEPFKYESKKGDHYINRYCALIGTNDPLCIFLGNYDRYNYLTQKWTEVDLRIRRKTGYLKIQCNDGIFPTLGANGFLIRRKEIMEYINNDYYFDIDVTYHLAVNKKKSFAKVNIGIRHLYASSLKIFCRKQKRRILDFMYFKKNKQQRLYPWEFRKNHQKIIKFCIFSLLIFPTLWQTCKGYYYKRDLAWFFHPLACWLTFFIYGYNMVKISLFRQFKMMDRANWF